MFGNGRCGSTSEVHTRCGGHGSGAEREVHRFTGREMPACTSRRVHRFMGQASGRAMH